MEQAKTREQKANEECENARKKAREAHVEFEKMKDQRCQRFNEFFEPIATNIDAIYKVIDPLIAVFSLSSFCSNSRRTRALKPSSCPPIPKSSTWTASTTRVWLPANASARWTR